MLTYNMDVRKESTWLRATPGTAVLAHPFYATEAGHFYGQAGFATARTNKESYLLFFTLKGKGHVTQNCQEVELPEGTALLLDCRIAQSYRTAPDTGVWEHDWVHLDGTGLASFADTLLPQGRLTPVRIGGTEMEPLFEALFQQWEKNTALSQLEIGLLLHQMLTAMARHLLAGDESCSNRTLRRAHHFGNAARPRSVLQKLVSAAVPPVHRHDTVQLSALHPHHLCQGAARSDRLFRQ